MQHVIIGTAGHIDHGKTTLIKALTGRDTDTLKEEKERGISINLGFTYFDLPSGKRAGIVDVPGHEKFIKNALAGIGGIDIVLLVIAGDEGVMPQTKEHLNILELLDIKQGIVVLTKIDMVDSEWLNMISEEVKESLNKSFLKNSPIMFVDSISGKGIKELSLKIDEMTDDLNKRDIVSDFRLPVDRVFTISGFGTVITGTLISGIMKNGDACEIYPKEIKTKIRNIQVHEHNVEIAYAGQRVAINLANIKTEDITRGDVISKAGTLKPSMMIDCRLKYLNDAIRPLKNRDRVRIYHGTSETLGRVIILDKETVDPGESALIQIRLETPMAAKRGDKFVIRSYSPLFTIGGGTILDPNPTKHKLQDNVVIEELLIKEKGTPIEIVEQAINSISFKFPQRKEIAVLSGNIAHNLDTLIEKLIEDKRVVKIELTEGDIFIHSQYIEKLKNRAEILLEEFHKNNPLKLGISREEFRNKLFMTEIKQKLYDRMIELLKVDTIYADNNIIWKKDFKIKFSLKQEEISKKLYATYLDGGLQPPRTEEVLKAYGKEEKTARIICDCLIETGEIIKINDEIYLTKTNLDKAREMAVNFMKLNGDITVAQFRDIIGASRKYALSILEYFDNIKLTKRNEDKRSLL